MKNAIALIAAACIATPALAWGDREQGALVGILGTLVFQHVKRESQAQPPVIVQQPQVIYQPPVVVYRQPQYPRLVIDQNAGYQCSQGLAAHFVENIDFRGNIYRQFYACQ
jgi:hypothetical protein